MRAADLGLLPPGSRQEGRKPYPGSTGKRFSFRSSAVASMANRGYWRYRGHSRSRDRVGGRASTEEIEGFKVNLG